MDPPRPQNWQHSGCGGLVWEPDSSPPAFPCSAFYFLTSAHFSRVNVALSLGVGAMGSSGDTPLSVRVLSASVSVSMEARLAPPGPRFGVLGLGKAWSSLAP